MIENNHDLVQFKELLFISGLVIVVCLALVGALRWQKKKILANFPIVAAVLIAVGIIDE